MSELPDLKQLSQRDLTQMNKLLVQNYPDTIQRNSVFPNGIVCGKYCLAVLLRDYSYRKIK